MKVYIIILRRRKIKKNESPYYTYVAMESSLYNAYEAVVESGILKDYKYLFYTELSLIGWFIQVLPFFKIFDPWK